MVPLRPVRRPLQVGHGLAFAAALGAYVPMVLAVGGARAPLALGAVGVAALSPLVFVGWSRRASDILLGPSGFRVEGPIVRGARERRWEEIVGAELVAVEGIKAAKSVIDQHELRVRVEDGSVDALAVSFGERDRAQLARVADDINEAVSPAAVAQEASTSPPNLVLPCGACGAPAAPGDVDVVTCRFCGAPIPVTPLIRERVVAAAELTEDRRHAEALVRRLLDQPPGARQTAMQLGLLALGIATAIVWAELGAVFGFTVAIATFIVFAAERLAVRDREALTELRACSAIPPSREGAPSSCFQCGAPIPEDASRIDVQVLAVCIACGTMNVLGGSFLRRAVLPATDDDDDRPTLPKLLWQRAARRRKVMLYAAGASFLLAAATFVARI